MDPFPPPYKQNKTKLKINKELKRNVQQRGWGAVSTLEKGQGARS
jgi:hypothetical protein